MNVEELDIWSFIQKPKWERNLETKKQKEEQEILNIESIQIYLLNIEDILSVKI